jgi:hypothetical protein
LLGEQGLCEHFPKGTPLVTSQFHPPIRSLSGIRAAGSYQSLLRGNG